MVADLRVEPALELLAKARRGVGADSRSKGSRRPKRRLEQRAARSEAGENVAISMKTVTPPFSSTVRTKLVVGRFDQRSSAAVELVAEAALGSGEEQALVGEARRGVDPELEAGEMTDRFGPDADLAVCGDRDRQGVGTARADVAHQHRGAAVDEALGQPLVERVGEARLRPRACAPPISPAP